MRKIEKLTAAQTEKLAEYAKRWTDIGLSTKPADRPRAEAAIIEMYRVAGLGAPRIVWCGSPYLAAAARRASIQCATLRAPVYATTAQFQHRFARSRSDGLPLEKSPPVESWGKAAIGGALTAFAIFVILVLT